MTPRPILFALCWLVAGIIAGAIMSAYARSGHPFVAGAIGLAGVVAFAADLRRRSRP